MNDRDQKIPNFPNCDNYGLRRASNPNPLNDDTKIDYLQEMDIITKVKARLEHKINATLPAKLYRIPEGPQHLVTKLSVKNTALGIRELYHY